MATYRYYKLERAIVLAFAAVVIVFVTMVACAGFDVLREPAISLALFPAFLAFCLAYPFLLLFLVPTRLDKSLPVVGGVAVLATWLGWQWLQASGLLVGLLVSIAAMYGCRRRFFDAGLVAAGTPPQPAAAPDGEGRP